MWLCVCVVCCVRVRVCVCVCVRVRVRVCIHADHPRAQRSTPLILSSFSPKKIKQKTRRSSLLIIPNVWEIVKFFSFAGPMFLISLARGVSWNITMPSAGTPKP